MKKPLYTENGAKQEFKNTKDMILKELDGLLKGLEQKERIIGMFYDLIAAYHVKNHRIGMAKAYKEIEKGDK